MALIQTINFGSKSMECYCRIDSWHCSVNEGDGVTCRVSIEVWSSEADRRTGVGKIKTMSETFTVEGGESRNNMYAQLKQSETFKGAKDI